MLHQSLTIISGCWVLLFFFATRGSSAPSTTYAVQVGAFQKKENAERRYRFLQPKVLKGGGVLQVEKKEKYYIVKIGDQANLEKARKWEKEIRRWVPDAFSIKEWAVNHPLSAGNRVRVPDFNSAEPPSPSCLLRESRIQNPSRSPGGRKGRKQIPLSDFRGRSRGAIIGPRIHWLAERRPYIKDPNCTGNNPRSSRISESFER